MHYENDVSLANERKGCQKSPQYLKQTWLPKNGCIVTILAYYLENIVYFVRLNNEVSSCSLCKIILNFLHPCLSCSSKNAHLVIFEFLERGAHYRKCAHYMLGQIFFTELSDLWLSFGAYYRFQRNIEITENEENVKYKMLCIFNAVICPIANMPAYKTTSSIKTFMLFFDKLGQLVQK